MARTLNALLLGLHYLKLKTVLPVPVVSVGWNAGTVSRTSSIKSGSIAFPSLPATNSTCRTWPDGPMYWLVDRRLSNGPRFRERGWSSNCTLRWTTPPASASGSDCQPRSWPLTSCNSLSTLAWPGPAELEVYLYTTMRYINWHFTYFTYLINQVRVVIRSVAYYSQFQLRNGTSLGVSTRPDGRSCRRATPGQEYSPVTTVLRTDGSGLVWSFHCRDCMEMANSLTVTVWWVLNVYERNADLLEWCARKYIKFKWCIMISTRQLGYYRETSTAHV